MQSYRSLPRSLGIALTLGGSLWGCTDNREPAPAPVEPPPESKPFQHPDDFDRTNCIPGSLAGIGSTGILHGQYQIEGYEQPFALRLNDELSSPRATFNGNPADVVVADQNDLLVFVEGSRFSFVIDLCARDADGTLRGPAAFVLGEEAIFGEATAYRIDPLEEPTAHNLTLVSEFRAASWSDISVNVRVHDNIAYLANYTAGLGIVDITSPVFPVHIADVPTLVDGEIFNDVKVLAADDKTYVIVAASSSGALVLDVTEPATPTLVAKMGTPAQLGGPVEVHTVFVDGQRAYLGSTDRGLEIYDLTNPTAPVRLGGYRVPGQTGYLHDLYVAGNRAYLNYWSDGMIILDISNPASPSRIGVFQDYGETTNHSCWVTTIGGRDIAITGDEQLGAHAYVVDVTEGSSTFLDVLAEYETRPGVSIHNIMAAGNLVTLAYYQDGVRVLDLSDPSKPTLVAWYHTWPGYPQSLGESFFEGAVGIDVHADQQTIYVADSARGLVILQLNLPTNP